MQKLHAEHCGTADATLGTVASHPTSHQWSYCWCGHARGEQDLQVSGKKAKQSQQLPGQGIRKQILCHMVWFPADHSVLSFFPSLKQEHPCLKGPSQKPLPLCGSQVGTHPAAVLPAVGVWGCLTQQRFFPHWDGEGSCSPVWLMPLCCSGPVLWSWS